MPVLRVHADAAIELRLAVGWYDEQRDLLGADLEATIGHAIARLADHPHIGAPFAIRQALGAALECRRMPVPGFPYVIVYIVEPSGPYVLAFAHTSRTPDYWHARVGG